MKQTLVVTILLVLFGSFVAPVILTQNQALAADINENINTTGFRLVICDGPEGAGHFNPATQKFDLSKIQNPDGSFSYAYPLKEGYIPCDFQGLMMQAQHLINVMIVLGVVGALFGFAYAGYLYMTGTPKNLDKAKSIFPKVFWGFILMLTAWFVVYQILSWLTGNAAAYLGKS